MPTFIEMLNQFPKLSQSSRTHIFKINCFLCNSFDWIMVKPVDNLLKVWQFRKDFFDPIPIDTNALQIFNGVQTLIDSIRIQKRLHDPSSKQSLSKFSMSVVDFRKKRIFFAQRSFEYFEMLQGLRVHDHAHSWALMLVKAKFDCAHDIVELKARLEISKHAWKCS